MKTIRISIPLLAIVLSALHGTVLAQQVPTAVPRCHVQVVSAADTQPVPDIPVMLLPLAPEGTAPAPTTWSYTDAHGRLELPCGCPYLARIQALGYDAHQDTLYPGIRRVVHLQGNGIATPPVTITGQAEATAVERSVFQVRVLDRERLDAQGAVTLKDALATQLNIRLSQDNFLGSALSLQGLTGQNIKILVDNVPVVGRLNGNIDLSQINLAEVERVELVEGPMSVLYGADALGGVINLITKKTTREAWSAGANGFYESFGQYNQDAWAGWRGGRHSMRLSGGRRFFDGWNPDDTPAGRTFQWKPREQWLGSAQYSYQAQRWGLRWQGQGFHETMLNRGAAQVSPVQAFGLDTYFRTLRTNQDLNLSITPNDRHTVQVLASWSLFDRLSENVRRDLTTLEDRPVAGAAGQDTTRIHYFLSRGNWFFAPPQRAVRLNLGYEASHEALTGDRVQAGRQALAEVAAFGHLDYTVNQRLVVRPGCRVTWNSSYGAPVVPSLQVKWQPTPFWAVRGAYARGFRAPSLRELYLFFVDVNHNLQGNDALRAETSHNVQLNATHTLARNTWVLKPEVHLFFNRIDNLITLAVADLATQLYTYQNIGGTVQTFGSRVQVQYLRNNLGLTLGGTYTGFQSAGFPVVWSPELMAEARYTEKHTGLRLSAFYKYTGQQQGFVAAENENDPSARTFIQDFHTLDATVSRTFWKNRLTCTLGGRNLLGVQNLIATLQTGVHSSGNGTVASGMGRSVFVSIAVQLP
jgi:outer membrane receptor for ferrienterochelin and colicins